MAVTGNPIFDDFGRLVGFRGGPYFYDDPLDLTDISLLRRLAQWRSRTGQRRTTEESIRDALREALFISAQPKPRQPEEKKRQNAIVEYLSEQKS